MNRIPFTVSARTAKLIGQENFTNAQGAIIELVKNSYDADAKNSIILFDKWNAETNQYEELYIIDDGIGMTREIIENKWMKIGTDDKLVNYKSENKRIKSGAKGIGRFALDRLGANTEMYSQSANDNNGLLWKVNWDDFNTSESISEVMAEIDDLESFAIKSFLIESFGRNTYVKELIQKIDFNTGIMLKVKNLRDRWDEEAITTLFDNLEILTPPSDQPTFSIFLNGGENQGMFGKVNTAYYDDFDYKLSAKYLGDKDYTFELSIIRQELDIDLLQDKYKEIFQVERMKKFPYDLETLKNKSFKKVMSLYDLKGFKDVDNDLINKVGEFDFTFYFMKNRGSDTRDDSNTSIYPILPINTASRGAWLDKFGGVKIFRDGFRVRPYGENGEDWLRLGERQAQSPQGAGQRLGGYRIRPNQISGTVNISRIQNPYFLDKSGREGIQENQVFEVFKNILISLINVFENDRNFIMNSFFELAKDKNQEEAKKQEASRIAEEIRLKQEKEDKAKKDGPKLTGPASSEVTPSELSLAEGLGILETELEEKIKEIQMLRGLASVGLIVSSFAHELESLQVRMLPRTKHLITELKKHIIREDLTIECKDDDPFYMIELMADEDQKIKHWLDFSLTSLKRDKRSRNNINIGIYFEKFKSLWTKALEQKNIRLELQGDANDEFIIRAFEVDLDSIFNNLLSNSINSLNKMPWDYEKKIVIRCQKENDFVNISFVDNGDGLSDEFKENPEEIFNAFITSKRDKVGKVIGTGLGLYIVKSTVLEYNSSTISIINSNNWFGFKIQFILKKQENV